MMEDKKVDISLDKIVDVANDRPNDQKEDYYVDGLRYCGICGGRKERFIEIAGVSRKVKCLCPCEDAKWYRDKREAEERERQMEIARLKSRSLMDVRYQGVLFSDVVVTDENRNTVELCRRYVDRFDMYFRENQGLLFYGSVGTGKSYLAASIANELLNKGRSVMMTSFVKFFELIAKGRENEEEIMRSMDNASLLIIDDLGAERNTGYALEKVFNVIDNRYRLKKPMIITTNLEYNEMVMEEDLRYRRIYDRIFEVCFPVKFTGKSWRMLGSVDRAEKMRRLLEED